LNFHVSGRAGRADRPGEVIVQTDFPNHPLFAALRTHDYDAFARELLGEREASGLPPYAHLALLAAEAHRREDVDAFLAQAHALARAELRDTGVAAEVFAPVSAPLERRAGFERGQMLLRSRRRGDLQRLLDALVDALTQRTAKRVRWTIDVDPASVA
jgi:primosomal protein N' (replication factor Y)